MPRRRKFGHSSNFEFGDEVEDHDTNEQQYQSYYAEMALVQPPTPPATPAVAPQDQTAYDRLMLQIVQIRESSGPIAEFSDIMTANFGPVSEADVKFAFGALKSKFHQSFAGAAFAIQSYDNASVRYAHAETQKRLNDMIAKQPESTEETTRKRKKRAEKVHMLPDMYYLNPGVALEKSDVLVTMAPFRMANIRSSAIAANAFFSKRRSIGTRERVRKTVEFTISQLLDPKIPTKDLPKYTTASNPHKGFSEFPASIAVQIERTVSKMITLRPDAAQAGYDPNFEVSSEHWQEIIADETNTALSEIPSRRTDGHHKIRILTDADYQAMLKRDTVAWDNKWYHNSS